MNDCAVNSSVIAPTGTKAKWRNSAYLLWSAAFLILVVLHLYPIRTGATRCGILGSFLAVWFGAIALWWVKRWLRNSMVAVTMLAASFLVLAGGDFEPPRLRDDYVRALQKYERTRYIWGGENTRGIDCSGLIRCGLTDAALQQGIVTLNPGLLRKSLSLWWHDASARELKEGYRGETRVIGEANGINNADYTLLLPGDFAVTNDGIHTLAYIGNMVWIEADPGEGRVIKVNVPSANPWFTHPVKLMRWKALELAGRDAPADNQH